MTSKQQSSPQVALNLIENRIFFIRGQKVMLDSDLATLYKVSTKRLNEQVKRNLRRFPIDFMFQLSLDEARELQASRSQIATLNADLRSQFATSNRNRGGRRYLPYAFTEHGAVMLASVLNSPTAITASIQVVRAFVRLRSILAAHKELARKLEGLERKTDAKFKIVFELIKPGQSPKPRIGYRTK